DATPANLMKQQLTPPEPQGICHATQNQTVERPAGSRRWFSRIDLPLPAAGLAQERRNLECLVQGPWPQQGIACRFLRQTRAADRLGGISPPVPGGDARPARANQGFCRFARRRQIDHPPLFFRVRGRIPLPSNTAPQIDRERDTKTTV